MLIYIYLSSSCLNLPLKDLVVLNDFIFSGILYKVWWAAWINDLQIVLRCLSVICGAFLFLVLCGWMSLFKEIYFAVIGAILFGRTNTQIVIWTASLLGDILRQHVVYKDNRCIVFRVIYYPYRLILFYF